MNPYRKDFPILDRKIHGKPLVYLDNGATTQKPQSVIDAVTHFYSYHNANIHRGLHTLSQESTDACDETREKLAKLVGADTDEMVFTYGTTSSINTVAYGWGDMHLRSGDEVIVSEMEHHANIVPWHELKNRRRIKLSFAPITLDGKLDYDALRKMVTKKTKLISIVHISNVLGVRNDVQKIVTIAKRVGAKVLIDAAQSIAHEPIDVKKLGIDFLAFSGHKMYGPTGVGGLFIKREIAKTMQPMLTGGDMILEVRKDGATYQDPPLRFEAGTINIAGIVGLGAAVDYLKEKGIARLRAYEHALTTHAYKKLTSIKGLTIYGPKERISVLAFNLDGIHSHDVAEIVNRSGVAIRSGNHCAMPLHRELGIVASARASIACYNTEKEIDTLIRALKETIKVFS